MARKPGLTPPAPLANGHDDQGDKKEGGAEIEIVEAGAENDLIANAGNGQTEDDESVKLLRQQLDDANARANAATQEAERLRAERGKDQEVIRDSRLLVIDATISEKETSKADLMRQIKEAKESGDYDVETKLLDELQQVNIDLKQAKLGKDRIEGEIEQAKAQPQNEDDRIEAWFEQNGIGQPSRQWLRDHKEYLTDPVKNADLTKAHHLALRAGKVQNTPDYFVEVEKNLGLRGDDGEAPARDQQQQRETPSAPAPSAPVSRGGDLGGGARPTTVPGLLNMGNGKYQIANNAEGQALREAAEISGIPISEYVQQALKLQRGSDGQLH